MIKKQIEEERDEQKENIEIKECSKVCLENNISCKEKKCKHWIKFDEDNNCDLISIKKHGSLTLRQIGERMGVSYVRIKQIEDTAIKKIRDSTTLEQLENYL